MSKTDSKTLEELIVDAKRSGLTDKEIGEKFNVSFHFIEKAITKLTGVNVSTPNRQKKVKSLAPKKFRLEPATIWSFKSRGNWATHTGNYRGNWSPFIPRNIILRYSKEGEVVLDCFCGSGATAVECKLLNRNFIGIDINPYAIMVARENTDFALQSSLFEDAKEPKLELKVGDARDLSFIRSNSIDLICTHPPYADIIQYTDNVQQDLSFQEINGFLKEMTKVARENLRVLRVGGSCAVLIGDMRKKKHVVPLGFRLIDTYLQNGFVLKELIIKRQHNCRTTGFWYKNSIKYNFLLLAHEYLAVFQKSNKPNGIPSSAVIHKTPKMVRSLEKNKLETMTVWISKSGEWYEHTITNLVSRYDGKDYCIITEPNAFDLRAGKHQLVVWDTRKSPLIYANDAEVIASHLRENGYLALLCEDIRFKDGTLFPTAINAEKELSKVPTLRIKEIVIVSVENGLSLEGDRQLAINHKYLLIYQKLES